MAQCWEDHYTVVGAQRPAIGADVLWDSSSLCSVGTGTLMDGRNNIVVRWIDKFGQNCQPLVYATAQWVHPENGEAVGRRVVSTQDGSAFGKRLFWTGGKEISGEPGALWRAIVLPYHWNFGNPISPMADWVYYHEGNNRNHEVVAMDAMDYTTRYGPLAVALIQSTPEETMNPDTSAVVVLRPFWDAEGYHTEEVLYYPLGWVATDVRAEYRAGTAEIIRIWAVGQSGPGWSSAIRVLELDLSGDATEDRQYSYRVSGHSVVANRVVLGPGEFPDADLFIAGKAQPSDGPSKMLVLRFGNVGTEWGFRWHQTLASDGAAVARDIGAIQGPATVPGPPPDDYIFVCGTTQREIQPSVFTDDFTVACYKEDGFGTVTLHWEARLDPQDGEDHAFRLLAATETTGTPGNAVAVVAGVVENSSGQWDWRLAKYHDDPPQNYPSVPKTHIWQIGFPLNYPSMGDDAPAAITGMPFYGGWDLQRIWGAGSLYDTQTGLGMATVNWEQSQ